MGLFSAITNFLSGGLGTQIVNKVMAEFPDPLTPEQKANIQASILEASREYELKLLTIANQEENDFNTRVQQLEGTASDLKQFGFIGKVIIFLRGLQRPVWGFSVLIMDLMIFSGHWNLKDVVSVVGTDTVVGQNIESAFWMINFLVLGFLFGERAMRNVMPLFKGIQIQTKE